jgi:hypothetical protein
MEAFSSAAGGPAATLLSAEGIVAGDIGDQQLIRLVAHTRPSGHLTETLPRREPAETAARGATMRGVRATEAGTQPGRGCFRERSPFGCEREPRVGGGEQLGDLAPATLHQRAPELAQQRVWGLSDERADAQSRELGAAAPKAVEQSHRSWPNSPRASRQAGEQERDPDTRRDKISGQKFPAGRLYEGERRDSNPRPPGPQPAGPTSAAARSGPVRTRSAACCS